VGCGTNQRQRGNGGEKGTIENAVRTKADISGPKCRLELQGGKKDDKGGRICPGRRLPGDLWVVERGWSKKEKRANWCKGGLRGWGGEWCLVDP